MFNKYVDIIIFNFLNVADMVITKAHQDLEANPLVIQLFSLGSLGMFIFVAGKFLCGIILSTDYYFEHEKQAVRVMFTTFIVLMFFTCLYNLGVLYAL